MLYVIRLQEIAPLKCFSFHCFLLDKKIKNKNKKNPPSPKEKECLIPLKQFSVMKQISIFF